MHVLAGSTALRALRAIRYREVGVWLPEPEDTRGPVTLSPSTVLSHASEPSSRFALDYVGPADETLGNTGIDFRSATTNKRIETFRLGDIGPFNQSHPLELAVLDPNRKHIRKTVRACILGLDLPASSLIRINRYLWVTCPELTVMLLAKRLSPIALAQVIMELCGSYALHPDPTNHSEPPRYNLAPIMSLASLATFAQTARVRGNKQTLHTACLSDSTKLN